MEPSIAEQLPLRAKHVAHARDSKARRHQHGRYYPLLKAVGDAVSWHEAERGAELALTAATGDFGAASLSIQSDDAWHSEQALWLVENQALFDRTDWLPEGTQATLLYYGGQLDGRLLSWLGHRPRASQVILFADYDGVGLSNFARLREVLGDSCDFWLMPQWESKLARYGSVQLWRDTLRHFTTAVAQLPAVRARADRADATPGDGTGAGSGLAARVLVAFVRQFSQVWLLPGRGSRLHRDASSRSSMPIGWAQPPAHRTAQAHLKMRQPNESPFVSTKSCPGGARGVA